MNFVIDNLDRKTQESAFIPINFYQNYQEYGDYQELWYGDSEFKIAKLNTNQFSELKDLEKARSESYRI